MKRKMLHRVWGSCDVLSLQEVHGGVDSLEILAPELTRESWYFVSPGKNHATGGVAILIRKRLFLGRGLVLMQNS